MSIKVDQVVQTSVTVNEGEDLSIVGEADGNPTPRINWLGQSSSDSVLEFRGIDRDQHGTYTCEADASSGNYPSYDFKGTGSIVVTVNCEYILLILLYSLCIVDYFLLRRFLLYISLFCRILSLFYVYSSTYFFGIQFVLASWNGYTMHTRLMDTVQTKIKCYR